MTLALILPLLLQSAEPLPECNQEEADLGIQSAMNQCAWRDFRIADAELNAQWKVTVAEMKKRDADYAPYKYEGDTSPGWFESLLEAQRGWLTYRDGQCRLQGYQARGGSARPLLEAFCLEILTRQRTQELKDLVTYPD
jgi:uncharacterized protein YecT (DUF1311 family)